MLQYEGAGREKALCKQGGHDYYARKQQGGEEGGLTFGNSSVGESPKLGRSR